jgi:hypothetical protein
MILNNYQITEIIIGSFLFPMMYFLFLYYSKSKIMVWDIIWCSFSIFIILLFKNFYINFNILQSQNFSSNNILNGIY